MSFIVKFFKRHLVGTPKYEGHTPEFDARREKWFETCTRDILLSDFTTWLKHGGPYFSSIYTPKEIEGLQEIFAAHANSDNCWDQSSLKSYLLTQIPDEGDHEALLIKSMSSLWALTIYFAQWPFNTASETTESLTLPALTRAVAFLCGRHYKMFRSWHDEDKVFNRESDQVILEYIFRALATTRPVRHESTPALLEETSKLEFGYDAKSASERDILDVLSVAQPWLSDWTTTLTRDELVPIVHRLSPPTPPELSDLSISVAGGRLTSVLELSILILQQASKLRGGSKVIENLRRELETAHSELQKAEEISFAAITKHFDVDNWSVHRNLTIYDAIALLFNSFTNPNCLRTGKVVNWSSGEEEILNIHALRSLGLTTVERSSVYH
ncbi:unnamed protein product [Clonostachys solani]|uniref:Uncharacterized protein n=1 Tax=Clonostachys solani TaxID=160281 RepID=A0A9P0ES40_9HYPO|nr:unnamed protein product [Clonostachys solani]